MFLCGLKFEPHSYINNIFYLSEMSFVFEYPPGCRKVLKNQNISIIKMSAKVN